MTAVMPEEAPKTETAIQVWVYTDTHAGDYGWLPMSRPMSVRGALEWAKDLNFHPEDIEHREIEVPAGTLLEYRRRKAREAKRA